MPTSQIINILILNSCYYIPVGTATNQLVLEFIPDTLDKDLTPFVQGLYWQVTLLGHQEVAWDLKDKASINQLVKLVSL